jgi:hypothetical protein
VEAPEGEKAEEKKEVEVASEPVALASSAATEVAAEAPKAEEKKEEEKPVVVAEPVVETKAEEPAEVEETKEEVTTTEPVESIAEGIEKMEINDVHEETTTTENAVESMKTVVKETMELPEQLTNGVPEMNGHKEVVSSE